MLDYQIFFKYELSIKIEILKFLPRKIKLLPILAKVCQIWQQFSAFGKNLPNLAKII
jgi:hypothetical protein